MRGAVAATISRKIILSALTGGLPFLSLWQINPKRLFWLKICTKYEIWFFIKIKAWLCHALWNKGFIKHYVVNTRLIFYVSLSSMISTTSCDKTELNTLSWELFWKNFCQNKLYLKRFTRCWKFKWDHVSLGVTLNDRKIIRRWISWDKYAITIWWETSLVRNVVINR